MNREYRPEEGVHFAAFLGDILKESRELFRGCSEGDLAALSSPGGFFTESQAAAHSYFLSVCFLRSTLSHAAAQSLFVLSAARSSSVSLL